MAENDAIGSGGQRQHLQEPPYDDCRRLFPFGLSPIPEVPSELASELSSICPTPAYHSDDDDYEDGEEEEEDTEEDEESEASDDTEVDSIRAQVASSGVFTSSEKEIDPVPDDIAEDEQDDESSTEAEESSLSSTSGSSEDIVEEVDGNLSKDGVATESNALSCQDASVVTRNEVHQAKAPDHVLKVYPGNQGDEPAVEAKNVADLIPSQLDTVSGAETASEIFRHLQATRDKEEVTTELAKILNVLETTLNSNKDEEEHDDIVSVGDSSDSEDMGLTAKMLLERAPMRTSSLSKKPPKHPNFRKRHQRSSTIPDARSSSRRRHRKSGEKDEMSILSKILVTLLCSCKTVTAAGELKKMIRQFRDAAKEATDEVHEDMAATTPTPVSSGRSSSRSSGTSFRKRRSSGSSNASHSEAESLTNTLTPNNTDSKSSEDEATVAVARTIGHPTRSQPLKSDSKFGIIVDRSKKRREEEASVSVTVSLPRRLSNPENEDLATYTNVEKIEEVGYGNDEVGVLKEMVTTVVLSSPKTRRRQQMGRNDSNSSDSLRDISSSDSKSEDATKKLFSDMECGAYNSDSFNSPGLSGLSDQGMLSEELYPDNADDDLEAEGGPQWLVDDSSCGELQEKVASVNSKTAAPESTSERRVEGQLISHLEETFKVLNGAYRIITGSGYNTDELDDHEAGEEAGVSPELPAALDVKIQQSLEDVLDGVTNQCVRLENEILQSSSARSAAPPKVIIEQENSSDSPWTKSSSLSCDHETSHQLSPQAGGLSSCIGSLERRVDASVPEKTASSCPRSGTDISRPSSRRRIAGDSGSRPASAQPSRTQSRIRISRPSSRQTPGVDAEAEEEWGDDDEWEYYYEDEENDVECSTDVMKTPVDHLGENDHAPCDANNLTTNEDIHMVTIHSESHRVGQDTVDQTPESTRPLSRQKQRLTSSRPNSRPGSRSGSRPTSRCSRLGMKTPLKGIGEDDEGNDDSEWEYYYEDEEEEELRSLSPTCSTTAPTTRATSPFPSQQCGDEKPQNSFKRGMEPPAAPKKVAKTPQLDVNKPTLITPIPEWDEIPKDDNDAAVIDVEKQVVVAEEKIHTGDSRDVLSSISEVSVALAAEYLGQSESDVKASIKAELKEEQDKERQKRQKHHKKKLPKSRDAGSPEEEEKRRRRRKHKKRKKSDKDSKEEKDGEVEKKVTGKRRLGVKDLVSRLEPKLFKDVASGTKMVMSRESAQSVARERLQHSHREENPRTVMQKTCNAKDETSSPSIKRKSVKEMVKIITSQSDSEKDRKIRFVDPMDAKVVGRVLDDPLHSNGNFANMQAPFPPPPPPAPTAATSNLTAIRWTGASNTAESVKGGSVSFVQMRPKKSNGKVKAERRSAECRSPDEGSEAYGTGSTASEDKDEGSARKEIIENKRATEEQKPGSRHSRLFRLLQDSDYTDSESSSDNQKNSDYSSRIALKSVEDFGAKESDMDSLSSPRGHKHSFRSAQSTSGKESSDCDSSVASPGPGAGVSIGRQVPRRDVYHHHRQQLPPSLPSRHALNLNLQPGYNYESTPEASPASEVYYSSERFSRRTGSATGAVPKLPPTRVWNYLQDEFDPANNTMGFSEDSSYQSQSQSLLSLESMPVPLDGIAGAAMILPRDIHSAASFDDAFYGTRSGSVSRDHSFRSLKNELPSRVVATTAPASPRLERAATRRSPKLEMDLMELGTLPPATHPSSYRMFQLGKKFNQ